MARRSTWLLIAAFLLIGVVVVIQVLGTRGGSLPVGQESPQATLRKAQRALAEGAKAKFLECFAATGGDQRGAVDALFDYVQAAYSLRDALRRTYGKAAWETFVGLQADPAQFTAYVWLRDEGLAAQAQVAVEGTHARVEPPSREEALTLRLEGVWRIEAFPPGTDLRARRERLTRAAEALGKAREDIGKEGRTLEDLARALREALPDQP